jgi:hypothetical protein
MDECADEILDLPDQPNAYNAFETLQSQFGYY